MAKKSVLNEAQDIQLATELIKLGARCQLLESETSLSRERILALYKEVKGVSPPKGMLPFSTDWFLTWQPNIHSSIFLNIYRYLIQHAEIHGVQAMMKAYQLYLEQIEVKSEEEAVLSLMRAWTLIRFIDNKMLTTTACSQCGGNFVIDKYDLNQHYVCGLCHMPSRAGKTNKKASVADNLVQ